MPQFKESKMLNSRLRLMGYSLVILLGVACSSGNKNDSGLDSQEFARKYAINPETFLTFPQFGDCSTLTEHLKAQKLKFLEEQFAQQRVNHIRYLEEWGDYGIPSADEASNSGGEADSSSGPEDFSETNTQVEGVDEPDIVKTNGTHIFTVSGNTVQIVASWPAETMSLVSTIEFEGQVRDLILADQTLLVSYHPMRENANRNRGDGVYYYDYDWNTLSLATYDVSDPAAPAVQNSWTFGGSYVSLRRIGSDIRLVQSQWWHDIEGLVTYIDTWGNDGLVSVEEFDRRAAEALATNEGVIATTDITDYVATRENTDDILGLSDGSCAAIFAPEGMRGDGLTKITTVNLASSSVDQTAIMLPSNQVYASLESLYVAHSYSWFWFGSSDWETRSFIHRFDTQQVGETQYLGSGTFDGYLKDQFSMDEKDGVLRLAVTENIPLPEEDGDDDFWWRPMNTVNRVKTMHLVGDQLELLGQTQPLAEGERVFSARFIGDKGYMVTFRQVDPLYTIDLSNPENPIVVGELKIPGFSTYMHPLDENHLLAVGREGDDEGRIEGIKISIFDISDFANPVEKHKFVLSNTGWNWSEALFDHHAFTYFASRKSLGIPIGGVDYSSSNQYNYFSELQVFHIDVTEGISPTGSISMSDMTFDDGYYGWWWYSQVRRSVFADDYIYAISNRGIKSVHNSDFANSISTVIFE